MWDCYEFGCGVDHETFGAEDACAECAAAHAAKLGLRQLDRKVAGLRARQAALRWPSLRAVTSPSGVRRVPNGTPSGHASRLRRSCSACSHAGATFESEVVAQLLELHPDALKGAAFVTVIVTKTLRNEPDVVRRVETARCRRLRPA